MKKIINNILDFIKSIFRNKKENNNIINEEDVKKHNESVKKYLKDHYKEMPKYNNDEDIIKNCSIRKLLYHEDQYLNKKMNGVKILRSNYKQYCFGTIKYKNKIFSIISLYRITKGKRSDFKYILIYKHTKNSDPNCKLKLMYKLYVDFNNMKYNDNYYKLFKNEEFINKIWKKVYKLYDQQMYTGNNKK